ncbi:MAG: metallophosphoesterase family protein [Bacteroidota bacterium]
MNKLIPILIVSIFLGCSTPKSAETRNDDSFSFIFLTDIHYQLERGAAQAFEIAVDTANKLDADFVLTGGDLVFDVLRGNFDRSDSLFSMYKKASERFNMPVYHCIGNHELFGIYEESPEDSTHPDYKYGMFERYFGDTYYSFDHKGWHFMVLNSIDERNQRYVGIMNEEEMEWIKEDLSKVDKETPIAIAMHIPLISSYRQIYPLEDQGESKWIENRDEVLELFKPYNLKLALQGHLHYLEDINVQDKTRFITGSALAGRPSWRRKDDRGDGKYYNEEGFLYINIDGEEIDWEFIDIGWKSVEE